MATFFGNEPKATVRPPAGRDKLTVTVERSGPRLLPWCR